MENVFIISEYLKDIIRNCGQVTFNKDDIIIKQGDQGDWYDIIFYYDPPPRKKDIIPVRYHLILPIPK